MSPLISLVLWASLHAAPCQGGPLEVPFTWEGEWPAEDQAWISNELSTWFASHGREGCEATASAVQERLVLVLRPDASVALEIRKNQRVIGERALALDTVPLEGRTYAIAALAEELARSLWERPIRRIWSVGATGGTRTFFSGAKIFGGGVTVGWSPIEALTFELAFTAAASLTVEAPHGNTGGSALWGELGARYTLFTLGPIALGPRIGFELGQLQLWGVDTAGLRREGTAGWGLARGGVFVAVERDRWALRLTGSMGRTLAGAIVLDGADRVQVFDGAVGEIGFTGEVRF